MKTIKEEVTTYECEGCGHKSSFKQIVSRCELTHKCRHNQVHYYYNLGLGDHEPYLILSRVCDDCELNIDSGEVKGNDDNQDILKKIYNLIKKAE